MVNGYAYIGTKDVNFDNSINYDNGIKIPFEAQKFKIAHRNSTLLCIEGGSAGRKIGYLEQDVCFGNKLATITSFIVNSKYIFYLLQSTLLFNFFKINITGIIGGVSINKLKTLIIPLPPLKEQQRIIEKYENILPYIRRYYDIYERLEKINNNYKEELKKSILQYAIQGKLVKQDPNDEPADVLINKILSEKRELIKSKKIKKENLSVIYKDSTDNQFYEKFDDGTINNITEEIPFEIPDNWAWTRLENLTTKQIKRGKSPKYINKSNVYVFSQKCNQKDGTISLEQSKFLDEKTLKKYDDTDYIIKSDIVINSTGNGTLGRIGIIKDKNIYSNKVVTDSHVTLVRVFDEIEADYIFYFLKCNQKYLELKATGSTNQTELSPEVIKKMMVPLPNKIEQQKIKNKIEKIFNTIKTAE